MSVKRTEWKERDGLLTTLQHEVTGDMKVTR